MQAFSFYPRKADADADVCDGDLDAFNMADVHDLSGEVLYAEGGADPQRFL